MAGVHARVLVGNWRYARLDLSYCRRVLRLFIRERTPGEILKNSWQKAVGSWQLAVGSKNIDGSE